MLALRPTTLREANAFVVAHHRHHPPARGCILVAAVAAGEQLVGVAIVGRPVSRVLDDGTAAEITRVCTDGTANAPSMLYGASRRACKALGYRRVFTYTLPEEGGASLRAAGFVLDGVAGKPAGGWHNRTGRSVEPVGDDLIGGKWRWVAVLHAR